MIRKLEESRNQSSEVKRAKNCDDSPDINLSDYEFDEFLFTALAHQTNPIYNQTEFGAGPVNKDHRLKFLDFIDSSLHLSHDSNSHIHKFRLWLHTDLIDPDRIDRYIYFAVSRNLQELELDFSGGCMNQHIFSYIEPHNLPSSVFTSRFLTVLNLKFCKFDPPTFTAFSSLRTISLFLIKLKDQLVRDMFSNCPVLENLSIKNCVGLYTVHVSGKNLPLKRLEIAYCLDDDYISGIDEIFIDAPNLGYFRYVGCFGKFRIKNVSSLATAVIEIINCDREFGFDYVDDTLVQLLSDLNCIQSLSMCSWCVEALSTQKDLANEGRLVAPLKNLKYLKVETALSGKDLPGIACLLRCSPDLEHLRIDITTLAWFFDGKLFGDTQSYWDKKQKLPFMCLQHCLKKVEIRGVTLTDTKLELLQFFIERAMVLDELIVVHRMDDDFLMNLKTSFMINRASQHAKILFKPYP